MRNVKKYLPLILAAAVFAAVITALCAYGYSHTFTTEKWINQPENRALFVDDMLNKNNDLIGFTEAEVEDLLGANDNDTSPFVEDNRYVYCLGMKGQFLKGDYYYLVIEFENGIVTETSQKQG